MTRAFRRLGTVAGLLLLAAACTHAGGPPVATSTSPGTSTVVPRTTSPDGTGISQDEAQDAGVLTGTYDALLEGPTHVATDDGCVTFTVELRNVGERADRYKPAVEPTSATIEPATVTLKPGSATELSVRSCQSEGPVTLTVRSDGRDGLIAEMRLRGRQ